MREISAFVNPCRRKPAAKPARPPGWSTGRSALSRSLERIADSGPTARMVAAAGVESGLALAGVPVRRGGHDAAIQYLEKAD